MTKLISYFLCIAGLFLSCNYTASEKTGKEINITIGIQPFSGISKAQSNYVFSELQKVYPHVQLNEPIELPIPAYNAERKRYRADSLIAWLSQRTASDFITIGITNKDISTTKDSVADWGVIGLGFCPGKACIASTYRLSNKEKMVQLFKIAIHELGHTQGLVHCPVKTCFMRDAEGGNPTEDETSFCSSCKKQLLAKDWKLN